MSSIVAARHGAIITIGGPSILCTCYGEAPLLTFISPSGILVCCYSLPY